jgi:predicted ATPase/DNA-binding SARP family transcriptional activator
VAACVGGCRRVRSHRMGSDVEIELLGPPGLLGDDGGRRRVVGRQQVLLALLALAAPRSVSVDRLLDGLWGDDLPADPANALQQRISSLRKEVDPDRRGDRLVTTAGGYALQVDDERIDARRFARLAGRGSRLLAEGDATGALDDLDAALALWRGSALEGFADEPWARADARRLGEMRLMAVDDRHDAELSLGAGGELVGELTELVASHPLRERPAGQLMLALYRDGRQSDALAVYDRTRRRLREELGVDPGPALQALYRQVLDQDAALVVDPAVAGPPVGVRSTRVDNLPARVDPLLGREDVLEQVDRLLDNARVVTLTGPGGTGKTSLAMEVARRRRRPVHGTWLVELAPLGADAIVGELAAVLGIGNAGFGAAATGPDELAEALRDRQLLLVLDNCEHVVGAVADLLDPLVTAAPDVTVLATSREPLGAAGEHVVPLPALDVPGPGDASLPRIAASPAVQLLVDRVRRHDPWFDLTADDAVVAAELVVRLDGIPLAIELAAAQLRVLSLRELAASLDEELASSTSPRRGAPHRHRTYRDALDWSWALLDAEQRVSWAALSVWAGTFPQEAGARVLAAAGHRGPVVQALRELADRSLLTADPRTRPTSYRMLGTIRTYGRGQLERLGLAEPVDAAHAELVEEGLRSCQTATDGLRFDVDLEGLAGWLDDARAVLHRAAARGQPARIQRVAGSLGWLWLLRGLAAEGIGWLDLGLGAPDRVDLAAADPVAVLWASGLRAGGAHADGPRWGELAVEAAREPGHRVLAGVYAAVHESHAGRLGASLERMATARSEAEDLGGWSLGFCRLVAAQLGRLTGRSADVRADAEAALELLTGPGLEWARTYALDNLIDVVVGDPGPGDGYERARDLALEGLALCRGRRLPELEARMRLQLGRALHELGEVERARRHVDEALQLAAAAGRGVGFGFALLAAGSLARRRGELAVAAEHLAGALELLEGTATPFGSVEASAELALTALDRGADRDALRHATRALEVAGRVGQPDLVARAVEVVEAAVAAPGAEPDEALLELLGHHGRPTDRGTTGA